VDGSTLLISAVKVGIKNRALEVSYIIFCYYAWDLYRCTAPLLVFFINDAYVLCVPCIVVYVRRRLWTREVANKRKEK
jgi:hypothetical protein